MNEALKAVLTLMLNKEKIGGAHIPENKVLRYRVKQLNKEERREFEKEYKNVINNGMILRVMKKTGKGSDWHISLNPRLLREIHEMIA